MMKPKRKKKLITYLKKKKQKEKIQYSIIY